jgi:hypothetical protein
MKNPRRIVFATLTSLILVAAAWGLPPATAGGSTDQAATSAQASAAPQSVSGKIASLGKDSFTLTVGASHPTAGHQFVQDPAGPKTMTFIIDKNTTIEGKLKVNANADVTYREDNGNNIAISVHVTP